MVVRPGRDLQQVVQILAGESVLFHDRDGLGYPVAAPLDHRSRDGIPEMLGKVHVERPLAQAGAQSHVSLELLEVAVDLVLLRELP